MEEPLSEETAVRLIHALNRHTTALNLHRKIVELRWPELPPEPISAAGKLRKMGTVIIDEKVPAPRVDRISVEEREELRREEDERSRQEELEYWLEERERADVLEEDFGV